MKTCTGCKADKPDEDYYLMRHPNGRKYRRQPCKECHKGNMRSRPRSEKRKTEDRRRAPIQRARRRAILDEHLAAHPCVDCGEADPIVLQFDHVRGDGWTNMNQAVRNFGLERLLEEIAKCDVRCANCHVRRHSSHNGRTARLNS